MKFNKNTYLNFTIDDFIIDEAFQNWVISPNQESDRFWDEFITEDPDKAHTIQQAKDFLSGIGFVGHLPSQERINRSFALHLQQVKQYNDKLAANKIAINRRFNIMRVAAVFAFLILSAGMGWYFMKSNSEKSGRVTLANNDLIPGSAKAILTIGGGQKIILTGAKNGKIAVEGNTVVNKTGDGHVSYQTEQNISNSGVVYNTLTTPRGGKYDLTLADGTKVWLDAASSITYPTTFPGNNRTVSITGQVYFEVAHNAAKPFRVTAQAQTVEVLGTHFNINAYADEPVIKTTLLEGSVEVTDNAQMATLTPGQQAQVKPGITNDIEVLDNIDTDEATAWKNGLFQFNKASIESIMRQAARWYDVEISYDKNKIPSKTFTGNISMNSKASQFLEILSYTGLHFEIDGKKIIVKSE